MPTSNQKIIITSNLNEEVLNLTLQPRIKFLLKSMIELGKDGNVFTYGNLISFMKQNKDNTDFYNGSGIKSNTNIERYWSIASNENDEARIPNFTTYYEFFEYEDNIYPV